MSRIFSRVFFSSASSRGVAVHGSLSQGMLSAMSCFSFDGLPCVRLVRAVLAGLGAGGQPVGEAVLLDESFDLGIADLHPADVDLREDQQPGAPRVSLPGCCGRVERLEPVARFGKWIVLLRIDQQQGQRGLVEEEPVDQPVILLPGQVPEQGLAVHRCVGRQRQTPATRRSCRGCGLSPRTYPRSTDVPARSCRPCLRRATRPWRSRNGA